MTENQKRLSMVIVEATVQHTRLSKDLLEAELQRAHHQHMVEAASGPAIAQHKANVASYDRHIKVLKAALTKLA